MTAQAPQFPAQLGEQRRGPLVLHRPLDQPRAYRRDRALAGRHKPGVVTNQRPVLAAGLRAHRVVEDCAWRYVEHPGKNADRLHRRASQVIGDKSEPPQRAELQRDSQLPSRTVVVRGRAVAV